MAIDPNNLAGTAKLTFADNFNTLSLWNGSSGTWSTNLWWGGANGHSVPSNGDQQWYIDANYGPTASVKPWTVSNGVLSITAAEADPSIKPYINNYEYTSGLINSQHSFSQTYGYFEMRAQLPKGQGFWPAFWLVPASLNWPPEVDIMEVLGHDMTTLWSVVHTSASGSHINAAHTTTVADMSAGFHTYGLDWQADYLTWYFDGVEVFKYWTPADLHQPMFMVANLAVGSYWPGPVDSTTPFPASMNIDYIRVYEDLGAASPPPAPEPPPPPPPEPAPPPPPPAPTPEPGGGRRAERAERGDRGDTGGTGSSTLAGTDANDSLTGGRKADTINGAGGDDTLRGAGGADTLNGGDGNDRLSGDAGADTLTGGTGNDVFAYGSASAAGDTIMDFKQSGQADLIDLARIDRGVLSFGAASTTAVSAHTVNWYESGGNTVVQADVNGNGSADFQITLIGTGLNLTAADFVL